MKTTIILLFILCSFCADAQKTILMDIDTLSFQGKKGVNYFFDEHQKLIRQAGLKDLSKVDSSFTIRVTEPGSIFELTVDNNGNISSKHVNFSWRYNKKKIRDGELLYKFREVSKTVSAEVYQIMKSTKTDSLLLTDRFKWGDSSGRFEVVETDSSRIIKDASHFGNSNILELSTHGLYKIVMFNQTYEDTNYYKPTKVFSNINNFLVFVRQKINYQQTLLNFEKSLPKGKYHDGFAKTFWNYDY